MTTTTTTNTTPDAMLNLRRILPAPRVRVFRAWTDPVELKAWFGQGDYVVPDAEVDLRVGGRYRIALKKLPDGEPFAVGGVYREISEPDRLVFTWGWDNLPSSADVQDTVVTVEFRDAPDGTEITLTHERFPTEKARDEHGTGWNGVLDSLRRHLESAA